MPLIQFGVTSYQSRSLPLSAERCLNMFAEAQPPSTKVPVAMFGVPGLTFWQGVGPGPIRAMRVMSGILYVVSGNHLYSVDESANSIDRGDVGPLTGPVQLSDNGSQLFILNAGVAFVYSTAVPAVMGPPGSHQGNILVGSVTFLQDEIPQFTSTFYVQYTNTVLLWQPGDHVTIVLNNGATQEATLTSIVDPAMIHLAVPVPAPGADRFAFVQDETQDITTQTVRVIPATNTIIQVENVNGMVIGDTVRLTLSNGLPHVTTIINVLRGPVVHIDVGINDIALAGAPVSNITSRLYPVEDINYYEASTVTYFDNYFVLTRKDTNEFFLSAVGDGTTFPGLSFATAQVMPDNIVGAIADHQMLLIFGERSIETWYNAAGTQFPFQRYDGATIERGCSAAGTILKEDNSVFFLGDDKIFYRMQGATPVRLSTHALETQWANYEKILDAFAFSYSIEGHKFICLTFPSGEAPPNGSSTFIYDTSTKLWHERDSTVALPPDVTNGVNLLGRWRGNCAVNAYNKTLIGDFLSNNLGIVSIETYAEFGVPIYGQVSSPPYREDRKRIFVPRFELEMETGVGVPGTPHPVIYISDPLPFQASVGKEVRDLTADPQVPNFVTHMAVTSPFGALALFVDSIADIGLGNTIQVTLDNDVVHQTTVIYLSDMSNPQIYLDYSKDGGFTYSKPQLPRSLGRQGQTTTRLRWLRLGQSREWYFRITLLDPIKRVVIGAYMDQYTGM